MRIRFLPMRPAMALLGLWLLYLPSGATALQLSQALELALAHNHDLKLADIAVQSAQAAGVAAAAAPNPTLTVQTMNINPSAGVGSGSLRNKTVDSAVRVDQLIERGGKRQLRAEVAARLALAARHDAADARRQLRRDVSQAYYDLLGAQERVAILGDSANLYERSLAAAEQRRRAGDLSGSDVERIRVDALRGHNDAAAAAADLAQAQHALATLLGLDVPGAPLVATDPWPDARAALVDPGQGAGAVRADLQAAQARLDAAMSAQRLALAGKTRDVTVGLQYEHYPASASNPQGSGNSVGVAVQIPLFVRYGQEGELRAADAAVDAARESLARARLLAAEDLNRATREAQAAADRLARYEGAILPAARTAAERTEFAFDHGAVGVMDVLDMRRTYRATLLEALDARAGFAKSVAALQAALSQSLPQ